MSTARSDFEALEREFHAARVLEPAARAEFLARRDAGSRAELERLLAAWERCGDFLEGAAGERDLAGTRLGEFTLVRLLGAGGMGAVYEALQDRPRRTVALKVVRALPGLRRDARRLAFEAEIMARLAHPNVARIHAAGLLEDAGGTLAWFAMELVEGARGLLRYADERKLAVAARLELFETVCRAVEHGHQRGVVHCDLKPDNLLVDESGTPKVIDFGVARAAGLEPSPDTVRTSTGSIAGTLAYMSPEQCGGGTAVDTRSDVYALGVILYELLTGARPLELSGKSVTEALDLIRSEPPRRPSQLRTDLAGDLEAIVLVALAKDPDSRYRGAGELADDLARHRRGEPIRARPPGLGRQLVLFARRHRAFVGAAAAVIVTLVGATAFSVRAALRATRAAEAETVARTHADRVAALLMDMLAGARPATTAQREMTVRELVDGALFHAERELGGDDLALCDVLGTLGQTYFALGRLEQAESTAARAVALAEKLDDPPRLARARSSRARIAAARGNESEAEELYRLALAEQRTHARPDEDLAYTLQGLGELLSTTGRRAEAEATLGDALDASGLRAGVRSSWAPRILTAQGESAYLARDYATAEARQREALALQRELVPPGHLSVATIENSLASTLFDEGKIDEAAQLWESALAVFERVLDPDHPDLAAVVGNLALVHQRRREFEQAEALFTRAIELRRAALGPDHERLAVSLANYGQMLLERGDLERALATLDEAVAVQRRALAKDGRSEDDLELARTLVMRAGAEMRAGRLEEAEGSAREVLRIQESRLPPDHVDVAQTLSMLGAVLVRRGAAAEAEPLLERALALRRARLPGHWLTANTESVLGEALVALQRYPDAEPLIVESVDVLAKALGENDFRTQDAVRRAVDLYRRWGRDADSERWSTRLEH